MLLCVQDLVRNVSLLEQLGQQFGLFNRSGTHQDRLSLFVALSDIFNDCLELASFRWENEVRLILADHRLVCRDRDNADLIGGGEFRCFGFCRTGHTSAGALRVEAEVVLQGDRCQGLVFSLDFDAFLGLDCLVHTVVVATPRKDTASVLVNDQNFTVGDNVVLVFVEEFLGADRVVQEADQWSICCLVQVFDAELVFDVVNTCFENTDGLLLFINFVVDVALKHACNASEFHVPVVDVARGWARNNEWRTSLINEDRVNFVDDDVVVATLNHVIEGGGHVVAQVVEAKLVVGSVGDVSFVLLTAFCRLLSDQYTAGSQAEEVVDSSHDVRLVFCQVVVDRNDVDALAGECTQVCGHRGDEGLAFTGLHFGNVALVQCDTTHDLDVEGAHTQDAPRCFADCCESFNEEVVKGFALFKTRLKFSGFCLEFFVRERFEVFLQRINLGGELIKLLERTAFAGSQNLVNEGHRYS